METYTPHQHAEATLNSIGDAVLSTNLDGRITYLNLVAETMTGWPREAAIGKPLEEVFKIIDKDTRQTAPNPLSLALRMNRSVGLTPNCILVRRDGHEIQIEDSAAPIREADGRVTGAVIVFRDVGTALDRSLKMSHLAHHDTLTGLANRLLLNDRLTEAIALARRRNRHIAVLFLDVDGFKAVNDSRGHAAGDGLLRAIAAQLRGSLRASDTVGRHSGDEFVIVLSEIEHVDDAALVARKLLRAVCGPHLVDGDEVTVTASIGVALYPVDGLDAETLIAHADAAMYDGKRSGLGNYRLYNARATVRA